MFNKTWTNILRSLCAFAVAACVVVGLKPWMAIPLGALGVILLLDVLLKLTKGRK